MSFGVYYFNFTKVLLKFATKLNNVKLLMYLADVLSKQATVWTPP